jgi:hypothetical protein
MGLGLANPFGTFLILVVGAFALGLALATANVLLVLALVAVYVAAFRLIRAAWRWYSYELLVAVVFFALFVLWSAPSPPVLFLSDLSQRSGLIAIGGMLIFLVLFARLVLGKLEDIYRAGVLAFVGLYFIAFLQALILMQGQVSKI